MPKRIIQQSDLVMAAALADYQKPDLTTTEIALKHGISGATLTVWAKKAGLPLRQRGRKCQKVPTERQMKVIRLASVYKYEQVGQRMGMYKQSVHRIVKRWRNWMQPRSAPFAPGDLLLWRGKKFTVIEATHTDGTLQDEHGKLYRNFVWSGGRMPKKIGENPRLARPTADAATEG